MPTELQSEKRESTPPPDRGAIEPTDSELLTCFVRQRSEDAFARLVDRHASMVLSVCRQILRDRHAAEDAFQATFLILAQRADSTQWKTSVAAWLHRVAYRTAMTAAKKQHRQCEVSLEEIEVADSRQWQSITQREERSVLHEELEQLPERYRAPLVLCYLEGKSHSEAAGFLECTDGVVKGRLVRGKRLLRVRLARRGIMLSAAVTAVAMKTAECQAAGISSLAAATAESCAANVLHGSSEAVSTTVRALAQEGVQAMRLVAYSRLATMALMLVGVGLISVLYAGAAGEDTEENVQQIPVTHVVAGSGDKSDFNQLLYIHDENQAEGEEEADDNLAAELIPPGRYLVTNITPALGHTLEAALDYIGPADREILVVVENGEMRLETAEMEQIVVFHLTDDRFEVPADEGEEEGITGWRKGVFGLMVLNFNGVRTRHLSFEDGEAHGNAILSPAVTEPFAARIAWMENVVWEMDDPPREGDQLRVGEQLILQEGRLWITYGGRVEIFLDGPCEFTVTGRSAGALQSGSFSAEHRGDAVGFVLETPDAVVVDRSGGDFAIAIDAEGAGLVAVSEGQVEVQEVAAENGDMEQRRLEAGESVRLPLGG